MRNKVVSADDAVAIIRDGDTIANAGFVGTGTPDELLAALARRYQDSGSPTGLTLLFAAGQGDGKERGLNRLALPGLVKRAIGGHWGMLPKLGRMAVENRIEAYNLPQGCLSHLYRDIAAGKPGLLTKVGLRTFVDPRNGGGRINAISREDLVELVTIAGQEWLFYKAVPINIAFIRGTTADLAGNITMEREALTLDNLAMAMAAKNSNGFVIAQVERLAERRSLNPRQVKVPGVLVDCVVVAKPENHPQTYITPYNPGYAAQYRVPLHALAPMPLDERKIIARRAAFELPINGVINLGIGMPEGVAKVAGEEKVLKYLTLTTEPGTIGGLPASGLDFGTAVNTDALLDQNQQFDFYDGGGLDLACLGMAQADAAGNVNVSRFGRKLAGAGGFINISQNARRVVFVGTFTTGGLEVKVEDGRLRILREGASRKFIEKVEQITFSGGYAVERGRPIRYVTERCVFDLTPGGLALVEVAPGIDIQRDILAHMGFTPIIRGPRPMDARIFGAEPMGLEQILLGLTLEERITYDPERNMLFLNFEGLTLRTRQDVQDLRAAVEARCKAAGRKVKVILNYDGFYVDERVSNDYAAEVRFMSATYYERVRRYTTSAFLRLKLGEALEKRDAAPHVSERPREARAIIGSADD